MGQASQAQADASYLLSAPGRSIPLRRGVLLRIGRHPQNELVLDDSSVSRFHARIEWPDPDGTPIIVDLGSTNGTLIDGARMRRAPLGELSRVTLGDVHLRIMLIHPSIIASTGQTLVRMFDEWSPDSVGHLRGPEGVRDLLLEMERSRRTVCVRVSDEAFEARVTFARGKIVDANAGGLRGPDAIHALLSRRGGGRYRTTADVELCEGDGAALPTLREVLARLQLQAS